MSTSLSLHWQRHIIPKTPQTGMRVGKESTSESTSILFGKSLRALIIPHENELTAKKKSRIILHDHSVPLAASSRHDTMPVSFQDPSISWPTSYSVQFFNNNRSGQPVTRKCETKYLLNEYKERWKQHTYNVKQLAKTVHNADKERSGTRKRKTDGVRVLVGASNRKLKGGLKEGEKRATECI